MRSLLITFLLGASIAVTACGDHSPASPTAPTTTASAAAPAPAPTPAATTNGATVTGMVVGVTGASRFRALSTPMTVTVTGTSASTSVDDTGHFTLQNVPAGHAELHFMGTGVDARLELDNITEHATVTITVHVSGSTASLDDNDTEGPDNNAEVEGLVTAKTSSTLTVAGKTVTVNASTVIVHGGTALTLADIHVGDRVHVQGTISGTSIVATKIEDQNGADTPGAGDDHGGNSGGGDNHNTEVELNGTVSGRSTSCPVTFSVSSTSVVTDAKTEFKGTTCASLANGDRVQVKGTKQTNGSVLASSVEKKK